MSFLDRAAIIFCFLIRDVNLTLSKCARHNQADRAHAAVLEKEVDSLKQRMQMRDKLGSQKKRLESSLMETKKEHTKAHVRRVNEFLYLYIYVCE